MVDMVLLKPAPNAPKDIKDAGEKLVSRTTAVENVRLSKGAYTFETPKQGPAPEVRRLEDMDRQELLTMAIGLGMKTQKQMKHSDILTYVRGKMAEVEIVDDE